MHFIINGWLCTYTIHFICTQHIFFWYSESREQNKYKWKNIFFLIALRLFCFLGVDYNEKKNYIKIMSPYRTYGNNFYLFFFLLNLKCMKYNDP